MADFPSYKNVESGFLFNWPDIRTYELVFSLFGNMNAPYEEGNLFSLVDVAERIHAIEMDMLLEQREWSGSSSSTYDMILHSLVEAAIWQLIYSIYETWDFLPDVASYNILIDCCSIVRFFKSATALVSLMVSDGFHPQAVTYTALIKMEHTVLITRSNVIHYIGKIQYMGPFRLELTIAGSGGFQVTTATEKVSLNESKGTGRLVGKDGAFVGCGVVPAVYVVA
ncbi:hypothetical protein Vadar_012923 [Vaccinium darrowii]|uniref:Uncharacterized protein n=1 Tax=Vaccinium darrowii TaxID=229202 RepID=A0ACB7Y697_9ERIC|nr:hypothetical protein Vadar_012923 [Vaccinium darrowii]